MDLETRKGLRSLRLKKDDVRGFAMLQGIEEQNAADQLIARNFNGKAITEAKLGPFKVEFVQTRSGYEWVQYGERRIDAAMRVFLSEAIS